MARAARTAGEAGCGIPVARDLTPTRLTHGRRGRPPHSSPTPHPRAARASAALLPNSSRPGGSDVRRTPPPPHARAARASAALRDNRLTLPSPTRLVAGDDDPHCPEGVQSAYGTPLGLTAELLPGAAHLDLDAGYGSWPSALQWCETGDASFTARPGQRP
ncbi:alpha/beta hydrolase [Streptomyces phaeoluteigriseus]|uniref:alpha/beta hydrolase n=1 Tax=Streptomyces phaeoluteigriseus TaxID=114686 RepID=UPI00368DA9B1